MYHNMSNFWIWTISRCSCINFLQKIWDSFFVGHFMNNPLEGDNKSTLCFFSSSSFIDVEVHLIHSLSKLLPVLIVIIRPLSWYATLCAFSFSSFVSVKGSFDTFSFKTLAGPCCHNHAIILMCHKLKPFWPSNFSISNFIETI